MYKHILVPLDGSELAPSLVTNALRFAQAFNAKITFFTMRPDYGATQEGALQRTLSPEYFADEAAGEANAIVAKALAAAGKVGGVAEGVVMDGRHPYECILAVAEERGCDLIYMASHGYLGIRGGLWGSQTQKVLAHAKLPVLVANAADSLRDGPQISAIAQIQDEHRTIAAVLAGLKEECSETAMKDGTADLDLISDLVKYIRLFPERLHHPKEERFLFSRIRSRTSEMNQLIDSMEEEHKAAQLQVAQIEGYLEQLKRGASANALLLISLIENFIEIQWRHMNTEEDVILPAAERHLTAPDWSEIASAFSENNDLNPDMGAVGAAFRKQFATLMNRR